MLKHMSNGPVNGQNRPSRGLNRSIQPLNVSTLSTTGSGIGGQQQQQQQQQQQHQLNHSQQSNHHHHHHHHNHQQPKMMNGGPRLMSSFATPLPSLSSNSHNNNNNNNNNNINNNNNNYSTNNQNNNNLSMNKDRAGAREALTSLGLLCLVSLLLALLSLIFLLKISPGGRDGPPPSYGPSSFEDYAIVYDVTLALCALSLSLNLCCLLVCAIQFLFAVKLVRAPVTTGRGNKYLQKSSVSRVCAVGGFFISIPIFLTGIILYTFTQFHSTPAIITSILIGVGIVFCGGAMVHNVFVWQKEKTISVRQQPLNLNLTLSPPISTITPPAPFMNHNGSVHTHLNQSSLSHLNHSSNLHHNHNHNHTPLTHTSQISHTTPVTQLTPVTPLSGNHSHISFNHSYMPGYTMRTATATPPTPKVSVASGALLVGRDATGSVSPGNKMNQTLNGSGRDASGSVSPGISPHELSTLV